MDGETWACERCGRACGRDERRARELIEQERLDLGAEVEADEAQMRGRRHWRSPHPRDPATLMTTPRYRYVRRTYQLCPQCIAELDASVARTTGVQRRAAKTVAAVVLAVAAILLVVGWVWPDVYSVLGLRHGGPFQPYMKTYVPPSSTPYKPPFDSTTPAEGSR